MPEVGDRFTLTQFVDRYPFFLAHPGLSGTVVSVEDDMISGEMDQPLPGAEEWDNCIHWESLTPDPDDSALHRFRADIRPC